MQERERERGRKEERGGWEREEEEHHMLLHTYTSNTLHWE